MLLSKHCFHWNKAACKRIVHCVCKQLTNCFVPNFHSYWTTKELITKRGRKKQGSMIQSVIQKIHFESVKTKLRFKLSQCCSQKSSGQETCLISVKVLRELLMSLYLLFIRMWRAITFLGDMNVAPLMLLFHDPPRPSFRRKICQWIDEKKAFLKSTATNCT